MCVRGSTFAVKGRSTYLGSLFETHSIVQYESKIKGFGPFTLRSKIKLTMSNHESTHVFPLRHFPQLELDRHGEVFGPAEGGFNWTYGIRKETLHETFGARDISRRTLQISES